ncbi:hypothetical protein WCE37_10795 [Luteimonas sp. MJ250]|uniref:hypothetical protein n=1 Tax=Luteimonas sp. MJ250 TaxID=3129236 RepID=UPI0031BA0511
MEFVLVAPVLGTLGIVGLAGGNIVLHASRTHKAKVRQFLTASLSVDAGMQAKTKVLGIDGAVTIYMSTFDVPYKASQLVRPQGGYSRLSADPGGDPWPI